MNALVKHMGGQAALAGYVEALTDFAAENVQEGAGRLRLKLKDGVFVFGPDTTKLDMDKDVLAVNPASFREGWIAFTSGNELATTLDGDTADFLYPLRQAPSEEEMYDRYALPTEMVKNRGKEMEKEIEYRHQVSVELECIEGPNKGAELIYSGTSNGIKKMLGKLAGEIGARMRQSSEHCVPSIALYVETWYSKVWKRDIADPKFTLIEWFNLDGNPEQDESEEPTKAPVVEPPKAPVAEPTMETTVEPTTPPAVEPNEVPSRGMRGMRGMRGGRR